MSHMVKQADEIEPMRRSVLTFALFAIYAALLIGVILFKFPFSSEGTVSGRVLNLIPFAGSFTKDGSLRLDELIENILIFVPFGIYIGMVKPNWGFAKRFLPILATTVVFEAIQYAFEIGRADITDVIDNALGGLIGIGVYALLSRAAGRRTDAIINGVALVLTVFVLLYSAFLWSRSR